MYTCMHKGGRERATDPALFSVVPARTDEPEGTPKSELTEENLKPGI